MLSDVLLAMTIPTLLSFRKNTTTVLPQGTNPCAFGSVVEPATTPNGSLNFEARWLPSTRLVAVYQQLALLFNSAWAVPPPVAGGLLRFAKMKR
jgi:hypothetical protein